MKKIQILGTGCPKCKKLAEETEKAAKELGLEYSLEKVTDIQEGEGSFTLVWKPDRPNTSYTADFYLLYSDTLYLRWNNATSNFTFSDGTNTATGAGTSFAINTPIAFHMTWSKANGIKLYINGVSYATNATYTPSTSTAHKFYIGSDSTPANHSQGTFMGRTMYSQELTQSHITADYSNIQAVAVADEKVDSLFWIYTLDSMGAIKNCDDSTRDNWANRWWCPGKHASRNRACTTLR